MYRVGKLLGIIFILGFVFFIICDEKGYKIEWNENHMVLVETEKQSESVIENKVDNMVKLQPAVVYKNSDLIRITPFFQNSQVMRNSDGMDPEYLAKIEEEKKLEEERKRIETALNGENSISKVLQGIEENGKQEKKIPIHRLEKIKHKKIALNLSKSVEIPKIKIDRKGFKKFALNLSKGIEIPKVKVEKYSIKKNLVLNLYGGQPRILYKNSDMIEIYSGFESPRNMYSSSGIDENFLDRQKNAVIISLNDRDTISSVWKNNGETTGNVQDDEYGSDFDSEHNWNLDDESIASVLHTSVVNNNVEEISTGGANIEYANEEVGNNKDVESVIILGDENSVDVKESLDSGVEEKLEEDKKDTIEIVEQSGYFVDMDNGNFGKQNSIVISKPKLKLHSLTISKGSFLKQNLVMVNKPELDNNLVNINKGILPEITLIKISKYNMDRHTLSMKKGIMKEYDFVVENNEYLQPQGNVLSDEMLGNLLENDDIDVDTLESENDEFLQKVFEKTRDTYIMNLIVENYLNEYQFVKAKKFIENLPEIFYKDLKPSLNLRVAFNSFALTSKTTNETLATLIKDYRSKNQISEEDGNWYLGILALMQRNYDNFFAVASNFTSDSHKAFAAKILGYKDQISKQMGMPEYYFDTLVALELFNQGLFQPAKVLALYSLQKNPDYILPHQILAYANFLTNSWDTSVEYLKKLADLDQNNAEKYRFLMGVAYYWAEKYEQSVTMLSTIQSDNLRLDAQRYLINDYLQLDQKNKLIASRNKLLGYENLVASDFYTYFYEVFYHPYSQGGQYQLYAFDTELANKMLRVCSMKLSDDERAVCTYGSIGRNIALGKFEGLEQYLLDLTSQYPQGYLYQALGDYYIQQGDNEKAKMYLLKAVSLINSKNKSEISQVKKLLETIM